ncbi:MULTISPECIES: phosphate uptake regulator PhoU [Acidiplasma]|jgi:phosphate uptake regulator|uniref:PhoU family transcriptional regulator n=2 Tax=Acidiplasma TaxID=507753 RepID=A0A0Q0VPK4_9ARCH|nr:MULTISPECIES: phosphate uptake regulator PhoU [Acidiplasma]KJE48923.1 PhoU family transcriptional regulator [Acidiplasma sp. MBA-1]KPV46364.1 PhoU family transcriptional regulator [Acidiplasma aeolicum]KQB35188.1 PhoU family transcriptional regulator [Acidiplasma aeolicum]KQB35616.1 PhoU family transcriptional regulator [Acidiplasma cupricumulans]WMT54339.1 MAG: phosphate uptake regulator PhoU [Acidiplasma sp.]
MSSVRKIQLTGGSTYIVSLPSKWVKNNHLTRGSEVKIEESKDRLVLYNSSDVKTEIDKVLNIGQIDTKSLQRALISIYISGFDTLTIRSSNYISDEIRDTIKKFSKLVIGIEIFEEDSKKVVLQNVLNSNSYPIYNSIKRMSLNVESMISDVISGISSNDYGLLKSVVSRDDEIDRFQWYIYREVKARSCEDGNSIYYLLLSRILERIADHAVNLCNIWTKKNNSSKTAINKVIEFLNFCLELYKKAISLYYSKKYAGLNDIICMKKTINGYKNELLNISLDSDIETISFTSEEITRIGFYSTDIAELAMDMILSSSNEMDL